MSDSYSEPGRTHVLSELGFETSLVGDEMHGTAEITPFMHAPGTDVLRTSVLAIWVDVITGIRCIDVFQGRVPVTLDLTVDVLRPVPGSGRITVVTRLLKTGRSVSVVEVDFRCEGGEVFALGSASFVAAPDASLTLPSRAELLARTDWRPPPLSQPLADRAGVARVRPGTASVARSQDGLNASNTVNGGIIALVIEEAALNGLPAGSTLSSMALRYLRAGRVGPVVATAAQVGDHLRVEARDAGAGDRVLVVAMTRTT